jgi:hypothetical protein
MCIQEGHAGWNEKVAWSLIEGPPRYLETVVVLHIT